MRGQGWTQVQIAQALGVTQGAVSQWEKAYHQHGRLGLVRKKAAGPIPRLDGFQRQRLLGLLSEGAQAVGFRGEVWTCARVRRVIQLAFGVVYHPAYVSRLLRAWGWSVQKPFKRASQRDEAAIEAWINARWPAIKKKRRNRARRLCLWMSPGSIRCPWRCGRTRRGARRRCCIRG